MKVQQHRVQLEGTTNVIEDWLWIDYHDRINVLIEAPKQLQQQSDHSDRTTTTTRKYSNDDEPHFIILQQTKYALEGRTSLAIVGGIIELGETPYDAAKREVLEETGYTCDQFHFLGRYRTDVNRGMGWTNTYLARFCSQLSSSSFSSSSPSSTGTLHQDSSHSSAAVTAVDEVGPVDTEPQKFLTMSLTAVREAVTAGEFLEIQWSATVALAMLWYEKNGMAVTAPRKLSRSL